MILKLLYNFVAYKHIINDAILHLNIHNKMHLNWVFASLVFVMALPFYLMLHTSISLQDKNSTVYQYNLCIQHTFLFCLLYNSKTY